MAWYKQRWIIEQFFRSMKTQGLRIEDSQLETAEGLMKLVAIAAKAAAIVIQLVQARNGTEQLPAEVAFSADEIEVLDRHQQAPAGQDQAAGKPATPRTNPRLGRLDHCQVRRMDRICFPSTTRANHRP